MVIVLVICLFPVCPLDILILTLDTEDEQDEIGVAL